MAINICEPKDIANSISTFFSNRSLIPIIGSGISNKVKTAAYGKVPDGKSFKEYMIEQLLNSQKLDKDAGYKLKRSSFSEVCGFYEDNDLISEQNRLKYLKTNFYNAQYDNCDKRKSFFDIKWPYIYSLNIDDAVENSTVFKNVILPNREFREDIFDDGNCLIKLHGDIKEIVTYKDSNKVLTSKEYAISLKDNAPLLNKLKNDFAYQNILFIGCSLEDEMDLKALTDLSIPFDKKNHFSKSIIFVKGKPNQLELSKFKDYGITDVVSFSEYSEMYDFIFKVWENSLTIKKSEIIGYSQFTTFELKRESVDINQEFFLSGKSLLDDKTNCIKYPYYFISRNLSNVVLNNLCKNTIHIIKGARISGKSYFLADLYKTIRDRQVFYFDGRSRLSDSAFNELLNLSNSVVLLDSGVISYKQFVNLLKQNNKLQKNKNNFIIALNWSDTDLLGYLKFEFQEQGTNSNVLEYELDSKFEDKHKEDEIDKINKLLPFVNLPVFDTGKTLLDQLLFAEDTVRKEGRFQNKHIAIAGFKDLSLWIVFACLERLYSLDIIKFAFDVEIGQIVKEYNPIIERRVTKSFEKNDGDLSTIKYVLNSKYWLQRELGNYAKDYNHYKVIADAYKYIVKCATKAAGHRESDQRKACRSFIMFDVMNSIFLDSHQGKLKLIIYIYDELQELLANDYNYMHQKAKGYFNYSYYEKDVKNKQGILQKALETAIVAESMVNRKYNQSNNERLLIALAHIRYTKAMIISEQCCLDNFLDIEIVEKAIEAIEVAFESSYNNDKYLQDKKFHRTRGVIKFLQRIVNFKNLQISKIVKNRLENIMNKLVINFD